MQENYYLDDGAYSAVRCVIELVRTANEGGGRDITALLADLKEATESREYRLKVGCQTSWQSTTGEAVNVCHCREPQPHAAAVSLASCHGCQHTGQ
jgi:hypothetical protein